jgi:hypothetical protein
MKKIILVLTLLSLVIVCISCAVFLVDRFVEGGGAQPRHPTLDDVPVSPIVGRAFESPSACASACNERYGSRGGSIHSFDPAHGNCFCYTQALPVKDLGNANTDADCSRMAGEAGYLRYLYDSSTGKCGARGIYEEVGQAETRKECYDMVKAVGKNNAAWDSNTKKCVYDTGRI